MLLFQRFKLSARFFHLELKVHHLLTLTSGGSLVVTLCRGGGAMNQPNFIADVLLTYSLSPSKPWLDVNDSQARETQREREREGEGEL